MLWLRVRIPPGPPVFALSSYDSASHQFDYFTFTSSLKYMNGPEKSGHGNLIEGETQSEDCRDEAHRA